VPTRPALAALFAALAAAPPVTAAAADGRQLPPTVADLTGTRSLALSASRGLAGGNEGIFLNAASLAARRRYTIEAFWFLERAGSQDAGQAFTLSTVDSQLSSVAGGFAYTRVMSGPATGNVYHVSLARRVAGSVFGGVTGKYLSMSGNELQPETGARPPTDFQAVTADASLFMPLGRLLSLGVAGYNLVPIDHPEQAPLGVGTGIAIGDDRSFHLNADWRVDFDRRRERTSAYAIGGELLLGDNFPVRAGWLRDDTRDVQWWSAGLGVVSAAGIALDLSSRQSTSDSSDRLFAVGLKMFLLG
jgi:hypothetical protein